MAGLRGPSSTLGFAAPARADPPQEEGGASRHLATLRTPALIVQGTRDPFGTPDEVAGYGLSSASEVLWLEDGDHDLRPRRTVTGLSAADHLRTMAEAVAAWAARHAR